MRKALRECRTPRAVLTITARWGKWAALALFLGRSFKYFDHICCFIYLFILPQKFLDPDGNLKHCYIFMSHEYAGVDQLKIQSSCSVRLQVIKVRKTAAPSLSILLQQVLTIINWFVHIWYQTIIWCVI